MTKNDVLEQIQRLSWKNEKDEIEHSMNILLSMSDEYIGLLVLPAYDKSVWDNAASVLCRLGNSRIKHIVPELLRWLQDMNWPGSEKILKLLIEMDSATLLPPLRDAIAAAARNNDVDWLCGLKMLVKGKRLTVDELGGQEYQGPIDQVD